MAAAGRSAACRLVVVAEPLRQLFLVAAVVAEPLQEPLVRGIDDIGIESAVPVHLRADPSQHVVAEQRGAMTIGRGVDAGLVPQAAVITISEPAGASTDSVSWTSPGVGP